MRVPGTGLRPMGVGELADRCFALYRRQFLAYFGLAALFNLPLQGVILYLQAQAGLELNRGQPALQVISAAISWGWLLLAYAFYFLVVYPALEGAVVYMALRAATGEPASPGVASRFALRRLGTLSITALLWGLASTVAAVPVLVIGFVLTFIGLFAGLLAGGASFGATGSAVGALVALVAMSLGLLVAVSFVGVMGRLFTPVVLAEGSGYVTAIARSWGLVWRNWWRTFAVTALLISLSLLVTVALQSSLAIFNALSPSRWWVLAITGVSALLGTLLLPLQQIGVALLYLDLRCRREGLDIEVGARGLAAVLPRLGAGATPLPGVRLP